MASSGVAADSPATHRLLIVVMVVLTLISTAFLLWLRDDRSAAPAHAMPAPSAERGAARLAATQIRVRLGRLGLHVGDTCSRSFVLPGFIISIGAGQVLPFLNLYIVGRFALDLTVTNLIFSVTAFGTMIAILIQPALARRFGRIGSVVIVEGASIPFLIVLGFAPFVWLVVAAMAVRNALMNASNPIFNAFAMDQVKPIERATVAATMTLLWSAGWAIGGISYAAVQDALGFARGYDVAFLTIIVLYTIATSLYWIWFGRTERGLQQTAAPTGEIR